MTVIRRFLVVNLLASLLTIPATAQDEEAQAQATARAAMGQGIAELVEARIKTAGFEPTALADDGEFLRRVYLDLTGAIPRVAEVRGFLADEGSDKRANRIGPRLN